MKKKCIFSAVIALSMMASSVHIPVWARGDNNNKFIVDFIPKNTVVNYGENVTYDVVIKRAVENGVPHGSDNVSVFTIEAALSDPDDFNIDSAAGINTIEASVENDMVILSKMDLDSPVEIPEEGLKIADVTVSAEDELSAVQVDFEGFNKAEGDRTIITTTGEYQFEADTEFLNTAVKAYDLKLTLNTDGGTLPEGSQNPIRIKFGKPIGTLPSPPEKLNYGFDGWYIDGVKLTEGYIMTTAGNVTAKAQYIPNSYTVEFKADGGNIIGESTKAVIYDNVYGDLPTAEKTGYTFNGWYIGDIKITADTKVGITQNSTAAASYTANKYTVSLNPNGGVLEGDKEITVAYDSAYGALPVPKRAGCSFKGWFDSDGKQITEDTIYKLADSTVLHAGWTAPEHKQTLSIQNPYGGETKGVIVNVKSGVDNGIISALEPVEFTAEVESGYKLISIGYKKGSEDVTSLEADISGVYIIPAEELTDDITIVVNADMDIIYSYFTSVDVTNGGTRFKYFSKATGAKTAVFINSKRSVAVKNAEVYALPEGYTFKGAEYTHIALIDLTASGKKASDLQGLTNWLKSQTSYTETPNDLITYDSDINGDGKTDSEDVKLAYDITSIGSELSEKLVLKADIFNSVENIEAQDGEVSDFDVWKLKTKEK